MLTIIITSFSFDIIISTSNTPLTYLLLRQRAIANLNNRQGYVVHFIITFLSILLNMVTEKLAFLTPLYILVTYMHMRGPFRK